MKSYTQLFQPGRIGHLWARNRVVMAPMATNLSSITGEVTERLLAYYKRRAQGGAGTIIVEAASVDNPLGRTSYGQLNIDHPRYIKGLKRLSESIQAYNCLAFIQISHPGRQGYRSVTEGLQSIAPSAIPCPIVKEMPREMNTNDIERAVAKFIEAAGYASAAGFDGVELHACHGYLINQFLSPHANHRTDEYGGSLENRQRFLLRILWGIKKKLPGLLVSVRINIEDFVEGGLTMEDSLQICRCLETHGADIIHVSCGTYESGLTSIESGSSPEGWRLYMSEAVKEVVKIPVIGGGMIADPGMAEKAVTEGQADFVFIGRSLLADPRWPQRAEKGCTSRIRPCIRCNNCIESMFGGLGISCTVNPEAGREIESVAPPADAGGRSAWIAGAGPGGMQAALSLARCGVKVTIFDPAPEPGGMMKVAARPPFKHRIEKWRQYLCHSLQGGHIEWRLGEAFEPGLLDKDTPDLLVLAVGAEITSLCIDGLDSPHCWSALEIFQRPELAEGQRVIILGGGLTGCELADILAERAAEISIVEKDSILARAMEKKNRRALLNRLDNAGVERFMGYRARSVISQGLKARSDEGADIYIPADMIVVATGFKSSAGPIYDAVKGRVPEIYIIGDAYRPRGFREAILEGHKVAERFLNSWSEL